MLVLSLLWVGSVVSAEETPSGFLNRDHNNHSYVVFVPKSAPPAKGYPLILFLHSAGERGTDGRRQVEYGIGPAIRRRVETFPGIVVFPQADFAKGPILETWRADEPGGELARAILTDVERHWPVDPDRRAITGWSMGAYGTLSLAAADPGHFSKVLAISGGGEAKWGPKLESLPVWLVHGDRDAVVPVSESRAMATAIPAPHDHLTLTEVPAAGHDLWRSVYDNQAVLDWLLSPEAAAPPVKTITAPEPVASSTAPAEDEPPFSPALVISRAISLRLGNEALQTLAAGVPQTLKDEGLRGRLQPVDDQVEFDNRTFDVHFRNMSYQGRLQRAVLKGRGPGRLHVAFALRDFEVLIGTIEVSDQADGVTAGPVSVIIGHRQPVWMDLEVEPEATSGGSLRLKLLHSEFTIGDNNWYVKPPVDVHIRGNLLTKDAVTTAIVGGVYQRKAIIEQKILGAVETILDQVDQRADFAPLSQLVTALWPLPVYRPRLQVRLEDTSTDANGVSLVFGCAVAGQEPLPAGQLVPHVDASSPPAREIAKSTGLQAAVAVDVMQHISAMAAGTDAMSLYAADVPGRPFQELDDVQGMTSALGEADSSTVTDVRSRLMLTEPFSYTPLPSAAGETSTVQLAIDVPRLSLTIFGKTSTAADDWSVLARRDLAIRQPLRLTCSPTLDGPTGLAVTWEQDATISRLPLPGQTLQAGPTPIVQRFREGWSRWARSQQQSRAAIPDVVVGSSTLRLNGFVWQGDCLTAEFLPAATVLVNNSDRPAEYCVRSEASRWSKPLTIEPHTEHVFRMGGPIQVRDAARWSRQGQPLDPGTYDWSAQADPAGRHWLPRRPEQPSVAGTASVAP